MTAVGVALPLARLRSVAASQVTWIAALLLLVLVTRLGSLTREVIDWDESTFILMATDVLHGRLPYVHLYDNKPPFMFFALAGAMWAFGESLLVARLFGDACVAITCVLTFSVAARLTNAPAAGLAVSVLVAASAVLGRWTQTEHLALALAMGALFVVTRWRGHWWSAAAAGGLMSLATLTRSNLIFVVVALGLYFLFALFRPRSGVHRLSVVFYVGGGLVPLAALFSLYAAAGRLDVLLLALVDVPIAYAAEQAGVWDTLRLHFWYLRQFMFNWAPLVILPLTLLSSWGIWVCVRRLLDKSGSSGLAREDMTVIGLMFAAAIVSLAFGGAAYPHYWHQLFPFLAIFMALALAALPWRRLSSLAKVGLCLLAVGQAVFQFGPSSARVLFDPAGVEAGYYVRDAAAMIDADRAPGDAVWALDHHLVLRYLDLPPVSPILAHPDNLFRGPIVRTLTRAHYVPEGEFMRILASEPRYVLVGYTPTPSYLPRPEAQEYERWLAARYELWRTVPPLLIYRRKASVEPALRGRSTSPDP